MVSAIKMRAKVRFLKLKIGCMWIEHFHIPNLSVFIFYLYDETITVAPFPPAFILSLAALVCESISFSALICRRVLHY